MNGKMWKVVATVCALACRRLGRAGRRADVRRERKTCAVYVRRGLEYSPGEVGRHGEVLRG